MILTFGVFLSAIFFISSDFMALSQFQHYTYFIAISKLYAMIDVYLINMSVIIPAYLGW